MEQFYTGRQSEVEIINKTIYQQSTYKSTDKVYQSASLKQQSLLKDSIISQQKQIGHEQIKNPKHTKQQHLNTYKLYFSDVQQQAEQIIRKYFKDFKRCIQHKIIMLQNFRYNVTPFTRCFIQILGIQNFGMTVTYEIQISLFKIQVYMLNHIYKSIKISSVGQGQYGKIYKINCGNGQNIVSKRIYFKKQRVYPLFDYKLYLRASKQQIEEVLMEYSIYKICSFFLIGPKVVSIGGFDIICFYDAIEFYMEECRQSKLADFNEDQMKLGLRLLHKLKIIHKDIKPENILFSYAYGKYVFTDFGISHTVIQKLGFLTQSYREGTIFYMSNQMKNITNKQLIDLYYNDYVCFIKSVGQIRKNQQDQQNLQQKMNQIKICNQYRQINIFGMLLAQQCQQISIVLQECQKYNNKLLKQLIYNLSKQNFNRIIKILQSQNKVGFLGQKCYKFHDENKKKQIDKSHLEFLIRLYGIDVNIVQVCIKNDYIIPNQLIINLFTAYQEMKYNKVQNLIFMTENEHFEKYLIDRLIQFNKPNYQLTPKLRTQKLYLLKNLMDIEHKNIQSYYHSFNELVKQFITLDQYHEYNSILQFYSVINGKQTQIIEIQHLNLSRDLYYQTLVQIKSFVKILKQDPSHINRQILVNILNKVSNIKTGNIYCRRVSKSHEINFHQEINNNMRYKILQGSKIYLNLYQYTLFMISSTIQTQIYSLILFKRYQNMLIFIENYLDPKRTNKSLLEIFYYKMNKFYKLSEQIYNSISYIHKFLDVYKTNPNFTMFELCEYYFEIASNYSYVGDFEKAIEYYLQIKQYLLQLQAQNTKFADKVEYNLQKCYYWLQTANKNKKQFNYKKSTKNIDDIELYCKIVQQHIYHNDNFIKIKYYTREIIYLIKQICVKQQSEYYLRYFKKLYTNQQFLELFHHFKTFITQYYNHNIKYLILLVSGKILLQAKLYKQSIYYITAYIHHQTLRPHTHALQNTYAIINRLYFDGKYVLATYVIRKCFKLWMNHEMHCLYMKLADCYKKLMKRQKHKKYLIKAILSKHKGSLDKKKVIYIIEKIIKAECKQGFYRDATLMTYILKLKFNYQLKKFYSLKCQIIINKLAMQLLYRSQEDDWNEFRKMKFHKQCNRNLKKILTSTKIVKFN